MSVWLGLKPDIRVAVVDWEILGGSEGKVTERRVHGSRKTSLLLNQSTQKSAETLLTFAPIQC